MMVKVVQDREQTDVISIIIVLNANKPIRIPYIFFLIFYDFISVIIPKEKKLEHSLTENEANC